MNFRQRVLPSSRPNSNILDDHMNMCYSQYGCIPSFGNQFKFPTVSRPQHLVTNVEQPTKENDHINDLLLKFDQNNHDISTQNATTIQNGLDQQKTIPVESHKSEEQADEVASLKGQVNGTKLTETMALNHHVLSQEPPVLMAPKISLTNTNKIEIRSKIMLQRFMGPQINEDGSVNKLKITKEELAIQKKKDMQTLPLCLEHSPRQRRNSIQSEQPVLDSSVVQTSKFSAKNLLGKRPLEYESDPEDYALPIKRQVVNSSKISGDQINKKVTTQYEFDSFMCSKPKNVAIKSNPLMSNTTSKPQCLPMQEPIIKFRVPVNQSIAKQGQNGLMNPNLMDLFKKQQ